MAQASVPEEQAGLGAQQLAGPHQQVQSPGIDQTLNLLFNNVNGGKNPEPSRIVSLLLLLRQQFSDPSRKSWPQETSTKLWAGLIGALRLSQSPEVRECTYDMLWLRL